MNSLYATTFPLFKLPQFWPIAFATIFCKRLLRLYRIAFRVERKALNIYTTLWRSKITVLMCERKPYPVLFSYQCKSYAAYCKQSLNLIILFREFAYVEFDSNFLNNFLNDFQLTKSARGANKVICR